MKNLYLIGGGGHCRSCIDVIELEGKYKIQGIFDLRQNVGNTILGYPIIGEDNDLDRYISPNNYFLITIGQIKSSEIRTTFFQKIKNKSGNLATIISPRAHVSKHAQIGEGTIVMHDALVNSCAIIGENCIINTKALVEHDVKILNHCHISTAAVVNGGVLIRDNCFIGSNSVLLQGIDVPANSIISAGYFFKGI